MASKLRHIFNYIFVHSLLYCVYYNLCKIVYYISYEQGVNVK